MGHAHAQSCVCVCVADKEMNTKINLEQQQQQQEEEAAAAATPIQFNPIALFRLSFFDSHFEYFLIKTTKRNLFYICCCCSWLYMCCCCCLMSYLGCCLAANGTRTQNGALKTSSAAAHLNNKSSCNRDLLSLSSLPFLSSSLSLPCPV